MVLERLLRVPWTARRSNQSFLKEISTEYALEGLMLKLKCQYFGHLVRRIDSLEKTLMLGKIEGRRKRGQQKMRWLDSITNLMSWVWASSGSWWWTGKPGVQSMGLQRIGCGWSTRTEFWYHRYVSVQFSSVQSLSRVRLFATPWITARQASLSITNSRSSLRLMPIKLVMPSSHLILCHLLLLLHSIFPSIRVFSNESVLHLRWPKWWSFSFSISPSNEYSGLISFRIDWLDLFAVQGTLKSLP